MNIKGLEHLIIYGLPVMRNLALFRELDELTVEYKNSLGSLPLWAMIGFDYANTSIDDNPYFLRESKAVRCFTNNEFEMAFDRINSELEGQGVPKGNRIYLACEVFTDDTVLFSGQAMLSQEKIFIDIFEGNRPSKVTWVPDYSFTIPVIGARASFSELSSGHYKHHIARIVRDILKLPENPHVDFSRLRDGYFFYHDFHIF
jgi:hypothetical protein